MIRNITIHFDEATEALLHAYTEAHHISRSAFIKQTVPEKLADYADVQAADQEWKKNHFKAMGWPETVQGLGL